MQPSPEFCHHNICGGSSTRELRYNRLIQKRHIACNYEYPGRHRLHEPGVQPSETAAFRHQVPHNFDIDTERRAVLRNDDHYVLKN